MTKQAARRAGLAHCVNVLDVLAELHAWQPGPATVHPSQAKLAQLTGRSERAVRYQVAALVLAGLLVVYGARPTQGADGRYRRRVNRYRPALDVARRILVHGSPGRAYRQPTASLSPLAGCAQPGAVPSSTPPPPLSGAPPPVSPLVDDDEPFAGPDDGGRAVIRAARAMLNARTRRPWGRR